MVSDQLHGACSLPSEHLSTEKGLWMGFRALEGAALFCGCFLHSFNTSKALYTRGCLPSTHPTDKTHSPLPKPGRGQETFHWATGVANRIKSYHAGLIQKC